MATTDTKPEQVTDKNEPVFVGNESDLMSKRSTVVTVHGREIVVFHRNGKYYALDRQCYHAGGPLQMGDIEDIQGHPCVICPWHRYIICMDTGEGLYRAIDPSNLKKPPKWKSKGLRQRTHPVEVDSNGRVSVRLSDLTDPLPSDHYHSPEYLQQTWVVPQTNV